ncbi:MAG: DUF3603 family protein [Firmicutes bacterium]|nr:DUF3603 family protein [Bacillota bacterium]
MNYIYDILVNFNDKEVYEFFEWEKDDNIEHIRKIPIFKVKPQEFNDFKNNKIKVDQSFLNKIKNKTEMFCNTSIEYIEYCAIITDGMDLVVIEFDKEGEYILKSSMLLDEMEDTLDESELIDDENIKYTVLNKEININRFVTRFENKIKSEIELEIKKLVENKNFKKLKYLYYEWFNKKNNDIDSIINNLSNITNEEISKKHISFLELINLSNMKKQL